MIEIPIDIDTSKITQALQKIRGSVERLSNRKSEDNMKYLESIDEAIVRAASVLDMEGIDDDKVNDTYEDIYHCGTCTVRAVMEIVYPSIEEYIEYLKS